MMLHILSLCLALNVVESQDIHCGNTDTTAAKCTNWDVVEKLDLPVGTQKKKRKKDGI